METLPSYPTFAARVAAMAITPPSFFLVYLVFILHSLFKSYAFFNSQPYNLYQIGNQILRLNVRGAGCVLWPPATRMRPHCLLCMDSSSSLQIPPHPFADKAQVPVCRSHPPHPHCVLVCGEGLLGGPVSMMSHGLCLCSTG